MTTRQWQNITDYMDTVGTTLKTFSFNKTQNFVRVTTRGNANVTYTIGSQSGTLTPGQSVSVSELITSFNLTAASGTQTIEVWAIEDGTKKIEADSTDPLSQLIDNTTLSRPEINLMQGYSNKMVNGQAVTIDCWGDSTYWGHASGVDPLGSQVATPVPVALQSILRSYYNNSLITVINNGTKGYSTDNVIGSWDTYMANSTGNIIFINYGINDGKDGGMTSEHYRDNLISMVLTARKHNKDIIFDTPNIVLSTDSASDGMGTLNRSQNIKHFAEIMRRVAKELNVAIVDNYERTSDYLSNNPNIQTSMPDGMHPSDDMYYFKALQMAELFIEPVVTTISRDAFIPCTDSRINYFGNNAVSFKPETKSGVLLLANNIRVGLNLKKPMNIYMATTFWTTGPTTVNIKLDGKVIQTLSLKDPLITDWGEDMEILLAENVPPGFHFIEIDSSVLDVNNRVAFFYIRTREIRNESFTKPSGDSYKKITKILDGVEYTAIASESKVLTDIATSNTIRPIDIEVTAKLSDMSGFFVLGSKRNTSGNVLGGITVYMKTGTLYLSESTATTYAPQVVLSAVDYTTAQHVFRITVSTAGVVQVFVDGVQVGSNYTMQTIVKGGYLGIYRQTAGTATIDKIRIRE